MKLGDWENAESASDELMTRSNVHPYEMPLGDVCRILHRLVKEGTWREHAADFVIVSHPEMLPAFSDNTLLPARFKS